MVKIPPSFSSLPPLFPQPPHSMKLQELLGAARLNVGFSTYAEGVKVT